MVQVVDQQRASTSSLSQLSVSLSVQPHGMIYLLANFDSLTGVTSTPALTWTKRFVPTMGNEYYEAWYALYNGPAQTVVVTASATGGPPPPWAFVAFSFNGVNQDQPFDPNMGLLQPQASSGQNMSAPFATTYWGVLLLAIVGFQNSPTTAPTFGQGLIPLLQSNAAGGRVVAAAMVTLPSPTSGLVNATYPNSVSWVMYADAIVPDTVFIPTGAYTLGITQSCAAGPEPSPAPLPAGTLLAAGATLVPPSVYNRCDGEYETNGVAAPVIPTVPFIRQNAAADNSSSGSPVASINLAGVGIVAGDAVFVAVASIDQGAGSVTDTAGNKYVDITPAGLSIPVSIGHLLFLKLYVSRGSAAQNAGNVTVVMNGSILAAVTVMVVGGCSMTSPDAAVGKGSTKVAAVGSSVSDSVTPPAAMDWTLLFFAVGGQSNAALPTTETVSSSNATLETFDEGKLTTGGVAPSQWAAVGSLANSAPTAGVKATLTATFGSTDAALAVAVAVATGP